MMKMKFGYKRKDGENRMFDYSKLKGRIKEIFETQNAFAKALGLSPVSVSDKLNNKSQWTQKEIDTACVLLGIESVEIPVYFFRLKS